jgi:hypothetical protein
MRISRHKYFDKYGTEVSDDDAFDRHGTLRNGFSMRVPTTMRDAMRARDAKPQFTDGHSTDPLALQRPGWRIPVVNDRHAVHDAYQRYETALVNAYRVGDGVQCAECLGSGEGPDGEGFGSGNEGGYRDPASDSRQVKDQAYRAYDNDLENAWRGR